VKHEKGNDDRSSNGCIRVTKIVTVRYASKAVRDKKQREVLLYDESIYVVLSFCFKTMRRVCDLSFCLFLGGSVEKTQFVPIANRPTVSNRRVFD
jgi:hypothetical protein